MELRGNFPVLFFLKNPPMTRDEIQVGPDFNQTKLMFEFIVRNRTARHIIYNGFQQIKRKFSKQ